MKQRFNYGLFDGDSYLKRVSFDKAVLWHTRQLSLRSDVIKKIQSRGVKRIVFIDNSKGEKWVFKTDKVLESMVSKMEGQEEQCYFPIEIAQKQVAHQNTANNYVFDKERNVYVLRAPGYVEPEQKSVFEPPVSEPTPSLQVPLF